MSAFAFRYFDDFLFVAGVDKLIGVVNTSSRKKSFHNLMKKITQRNTNGTAVERILNF